MKTVKCPNCGSNIDRRVCKYCRTVFNGEIPSLSREELFEVITPEDFCMLIEDIFAIPDVVVTGRVVSGSILVGDIVNIGDKKVRVKDINKFMNKKLTSILTAKMGEDCGLVLAGIKKEDVTRGQVAYILR